MNKIPELSFFYGSLTGRGVQLSHNNDVNINTENHKPEEFFRSYLMGDNFFRALLNLILILSMMTTILISVLGCHEEKKIRVPEDIKLGNLQNDIIRSLQSYCNECKIENTLDTYVIINPLNREYGEERNIIYIKSSGNIIIGWGAAYVFNEINAYNKFYNIIVQRNNASDWERGTATVNGVYGECLNKKYKEKNDVDVICRGLSNGNYIISYGHPFNN